MAVSAPKEIVRGPDGRAMPVRPIRIEGDVAYVPLTKGYEAIIDVADVLLVEGFNWTAMVQPHQVCAYRKSMKKNIYFHRVIMGGPDGLEIDHIDCDGLNNRRSNLRVATRAQNGANRRLQTKNKFRMKGVSFHGPSGLFRACITKDKVTKSLGYFKCPTAAHFAYARASREIHGEFGRAS